MGKLTLIGRLAVRDIRHRPAQAILLLLAIATGAATLTLGLALQGTTNSPYARTRAVTNGPDVIATVTPGGSGTGPATTARPGSPGGAHGPGQPPAGGLAALEQAPGVAAHSGPFPVTWALLRMGHLTVSAEVEGRSTAPSPVDQPRLLSGTWVRPGGVVVEAAFASQFGVRAGDRLSLGGKSFEVAGTAVTAAVPEYPDVCAGLGCFLAGPVSRYNPGLIWATRADAGQIVRAAPGSPVAWFLNLKLSDPATAAAFAGRYNASAAPSAPFLSPWQQIRDSDALEIAKVRLVLLTASWLLALLAVASLAVLVGGRMAEQTRRVGLLKAVGGTPRLVAVVLLCEHVLVGLCAAGAGLLVGRLAAPLLNGPGAGLIGAPRAPALTPATIVLVIAVAVAVAIAATFVPAVRAARQSTVAALEDSARTPRRREAVILLSAHLPVTLLLGLRLAVRRPLRLLLAVFSITVTASGLVAILVMRATAAQWDLSPKLGEVTAIISVMLFVMAAVNAVFIAWATALDARHSAALARALGATQGQITAGLCAALLFPAVTGALFGIPGGIAVFDAAKRGGGTAIPSPLWLIGMVAATLLVVAGLTAIAARTSTRRPPAEILQAESA